MIELYDLAPSVNAYKVRLMLSLLGIRYSTRSVDVMKGAHKTPEYYLKHPFGLVPVLIDGEEVVWDSQAILFYLAAKYDAANWLPGDPGSIANVVSWLSVASNEVHNGPFQARVTKLFNRSFGVELEFLQRRSVALLKTLDQHLSDHDWLAADHATVADVAVYPGIAQAHEGGVDIEPFLAVGRWKQRFEGLAGFVPISEPARA